ncbi:MAG: heavy-metal-associated domain-containing protein [Sedimenticola sp.]|uniref:Heavy-metal-associated domain-containing protein n=1 Tax=Sedimenticola thiotaurini TaxID=1543721 RepID=A0A558D0U3_9GAMM|nr:heavy-metal-associated domain-containing protein [Sedimenticola sp.]TVT54634.1 MAG: heavy-metal-associated domain-containing protein [Sedimenticola thiotaurini]MCW8921866.1 heavy-metal-associated domain-containing protein [Sedimenticola sp.]MCW8947607.1 heavy-metal-associated domain-containing protein [Sedimenticola sp.]MCW8950202.1 heavy-metal-associated domain-containing protein [Sedimenticola sp.]
MSKTYKVEGMSCGGCASSVEQAIKAVAQQASVEVKLEGGLVTVSGVEDENLVKQAVEDAGFTFTGLA